MKIKEKYNNKILKWLKGKVYDNPDEMVLGFTFLNRIWYSDSLEELSDAIRKHERTHCRQQILDSYVAPVTFFVKYIYYFIKNLIKYKNASEAYFNIPAEKEAYDETTIIHNSTIENIDSTFELATNASYARLRIFSLYSFIIFVIIIYLNLVF